MRFSLFLLVERSVEEMNDILEKTASSLAVVEKKPQRPGGCVGIFFQLFDWNRRFAKKKLFSKKLLPPGLLVPLINCFLCICLRKDSLRMSHYCNMFFFLHWCV